MLFDTFQYWLFFLIVVAGFYSLPFRYGKVVLLLASYVFYMWWDVRFVALILASTIIDFFLGILLEDATARHRKALLVVSLIVNLGILGFFKYYNFFAATLATALKLPPDSWALNIILPVGISFYTFASLSYTIDIYRGNMRAVRSLLDYAVFIAFFPHLVAGPIIRAKQFLPQIHRWRRPSGHTVQRGIVLVLSGLVKKTVFADHFALESDLYFNDIAGHPGWFAAWSGAIAFAFQIYFDFSGYTDIARGCANLLGFEFPLNFLRPYLSPNVAEFWQRWHITLSVWVRDYLFMPMVRKHRSRSWIYFSLLFTMTLVGLWHGARSTFVLWGAYFGVLLVGYRIVQTSTSHTVVGRVLANRWLTPVNVVIVFACVVIGMAFFRPTSLVESAQVFRCLFNWQRPPGISVLSNSSLVLIFVSFIIAVLEERHQLITRLAVARRWVKVAAYISVFLALELCSMSDHKFPFIYFQF
jgi:D-alanyl-lipoteichoic acid acyltransferase DltB (MBOAT superfamily)